MTTVREKIDKYFNGTYVHLASFPYILETTSILPSKQYRISQERFLDVTTRSCGNKVFDTTNFVHGERV